MNILTSFSGIHKGVPSLSTPAFTITPIITGFDLLKQASFTISKAHGNIASEP
jgi:hypothetical protein